MAETAFFPIPFLREFGNGIFVLGMGGQCFVFCGQVTGDPQLCQRPVFVACGLRFSLCYVVLVFQASCEVSLSAQLRNGGLWRENRRELEGTGKTRCEERGDDD